MLKRAEPTRWHHPMPKRQLWIQKYVELVGTCPLGKDLTIKHSKWLPVLGWQILDVKYYVAWNITTTFICEETESFPKATSNYKIKEICFISITEFKFQKTQSYIQLNDDKSVNPTLERHDRTVNTWIVLIHEGRLGMERDLHIRMFLLAWFTHIYSWLASVSIFASKSERLLAAVSSWETYASFPSFPPTSFSARLKLAPTLSL